MISTTLVSAIVVTFFIRLGGVFLGSSLFNSERVSELMSCLTYAMLGALTTQLLLLPSSELASISLWVRFSACAIGALVVAVMRWSLLSGLFFSTVTFTALLFVEF